MCTASQDQWQWEPTSLWQVFHIVSQWLCIEHDSERVPHRTGHCVATSICKACAKHCCSSVEMILLWCQEVGHLRYFASMESHALGFFSPPCLGEEQFVFTLQVEDLSGLGVALHGAQLSHLSSSYLQGKGRVRSEAQPPYSYRTLPVWMREPPLPPFVKYCKIYSFQYLPYAVITHLLKACLDLLHPTAVYPNWTFGKILSPKSH